MKTNTNLLAFVFFGLTCLGGYLLFQQWGSLRAVRTERDGLRDTTNLLVRLVLKKDETIATLTTKVRAGEKAADEAQARISKAVTDKKAAITQLSDAQAKLTALRVAFNNGDITAGRLRDSLSALPIFTEDQANRKYMELVYERDMWRDSTRAVYEQLGQKDDRISDLERELNGTRQDIDDTRQFVQDGVSEARGLLARKRRTVLRQVDTRLQAIQKRPH